MAPLSFVSFESNHTMPLTWAKTSTHTYTPHIQSGSRNLCIASSFPPTHFLQESSFFIWSKWKHAFQVEKIIWKPISEEETHILRTGVVAPRYHWKRSWRSRVWLIHPTVQLPLQVRRSRISPSSCHLLLTTATESLAQYVTAVFHCCLVYKDRMYFFMCASIVMYLWHQVIKNKADT